MKCSDQAVEPVAHEIIFDIYRLAIPAMGHKRTSGARAAQVRFVSIAGIIAIRLYFIKPAGRYLDGGAVSHTNSQTLGWSLRCN
jgi:hypothetical protein